MLVDKKSVPWIVVAVAGFIVAAAIYFPYAHHAEKGPTGGSFAGIVYGIVGTALMAFAMLLALRKRLRTWQIGRVYQWTQGHVWLALLSYPLILFHAGMHWGPAPHSLNPLNWNLTWVMMWVFTIVVVSGIFGVIIQNIVPSRMLNEVQLETIYDQINHVIGQLADEAENLVINASTVEEESPSVDVAGGTAVATQPAAVMSNAVQQLKTFYESQIEPYLASSSGRGCLMTSTARSTAAFDDMRRALPPSMRQTLSDLESVVNERRQLDHQRSLHHWLHTWLMIHVPLSYALTVMAIVHIVVALRYRS